jgi:hypothetical protein
VDGPTFTITSRNELTHNPLTLNFRCNQYDWQVFSMTQVCEALVPALSVSELSVQCYLSDVNLSYSDRQYLHSGAQDTFRSIMWHEFLRPFNGVKRLDVRDWLAEELSSALGADDAGLLLPELQELDLNDAGSHTEPEMAFAAFMNARQSAGRPVNLAPPPPQLPLPSPPSESMRVPPSLRPWLPPSPPFPLLSLPAQTSRR